MTSCLHLVPHVAQLPNKREPDLRFLSLSLWVIGRQFPDAEDYWDANWLNVRAEARANGAAVEVIGPILHLSELISFISDLEKLDSGLAGTAYLGGDLEPSLKIELAIGSMGAVTGAIEITPDHMTQAHKFIVSCDQTYIQPIIVKCKEVLLNYPIKGHV